MYRSRSGWMIPHQAISERDGPAHGSIPPTASKSPLHRTLHPLVTSVPIHWLANGPILQPPREHPVLRGVAAGRGRRPGTSSFTKVSGGWPTPDLALDDDYPSRRCGRRSARSSLPALYPHSPSDPSLQTNQLMSLLGHRSPSRRLRQAHRGASRLPEERVAGSLSLALPPC
jgi:hypothetical protein